MTEKSYTCAKLVDHDVTGYCRAADKRIRYDKTEKGFKKLHMPFSNLKARRPPRDVACQVGLFLCSEYVWAFRNLNFLLLLMKRQ